MYELSVTRLIAAPPAKVWDVLTNRMGEWWCPRPWRAEVERMDRAAGGQSLIVMHGPDGEVNRHPGFIAAWDEGRRFAMTDAITGDLEPAGPFMLGIWEVEAEGSGTRYTARARHWTPESMAHHKEMGFAEGWGICADQLQALCEGA
ncbi:SRPBCC domain-containing protein [Novosphingobium arvoryzae]|uniref:Activator of HSP90 ATPase n=1 Tax=Novosphingobium arvoryzae TaxID=1256514 RepID=A0A918VIV1_9SPHN|nr:SRPBCC domain-containing protein [Novosphingobium arvoryzae]GGZ99969.1 activator of HSP90 ATPase [Novosphingobium arvoryzae]